jgi:hypothetical protein
VYPAYQYTIENPMSQHGRFYGDFEVQEFMQDKFRVSKSAWTTKRPTTSPYLLHLIMNRRRRQIFSGTLTLMHLPWYAMNMAEINHTLSHEEYVSWQCILHMSEHEREQVDTICTSLINLGMTAMVARSHALYTYRVVKDSML